MSYGIHTTITDTYDFTEKWKFLKWENTREQNLIGLGNAAATTMQSIGFGNPYQVEIHIYEENSIGGIEME